MDFAEKLDMMDDDCDIEGYPLATADVNYTSNIVAKITDESITFTNNMYGRAVEQWGFNKQDILDKLAELERYKRDEADGRLVVLERHKIKDGSTVWTVHNGEIQQGNVHWCTDEFVMFFRNLTREFSFYNKDIGKTVFLTPEAAQAELEGGSR